MDWAALSYWISHRGLLHILRIWGPFHEHRAAGGRGTEISRQVSAWWCLVALPASCRAEQWKVTLVRCVWGGSWPVWGRAAVMEQCQDCGVSPGLWCFTLGAFISLQCLWPSACHMHEMCLTQGLSSGQAQTGGLMELIVQSFIAENPPWL